MAHHLFRHTPQKHMGQAGTAMRAHHNQVDPVFSRHLDNRLGRITTRDLDRRPTAKGVRDQVPQPSQRLKSSFRPTVLISVVMISCTFIPAPSFNAFCLMLFVAQLV